MSKQFYYDELKRLAKQFIIMFLVLVFVCYNVDEREDVFNLGFCLIAGTILFQYLNIRQMYKNIKKYNGEK